MKIMISMLIFLMVSSSVQAYSKRIVFEKFKNTAGAALALDKFKKEKLYNELDSLAKGNDVKIYVCSSDNVIVAEPIHNKYVLETIMDLARLRFKEVHSEDLLSLCKDVYEAKSTNINVKSNEIYQKSIIFITFANKVNVDTELKNLKKDHMYKKLHALAIKNNFTIHPRPLGKYTSIVAEPILSVYLYNEVIKLVKKRYSQPYGVTYTGSINPKPSVKKVPKDDKDSISSKVYKKSIIFITFGQKSNLDTELKNFKKDHIYSELQALAQKNDFIVHTRPKDKYLIIVAEPILSSEIYDKVMKLVKKRYKNPYSMPYLGTLKSKSFQTKAFKAKIPQKKLIKDSNIQKHSSLAKSVTVAIKEGVSNNIAEIKKEDMKIRKPQQNIEIVQKTKEVQKDYIQTINTKIKKVQKKDAGTINKNLQDSGYFSWWYVFLSIVLFVLFALYKKYKPIYDEY